MHVIVGILVVIGSFLLSLDHVTADFNGFFNLYSMILLTGVPIGLALMSFRFSVLWSALGGLKRSLTDSPNRDREEMTRLLLDFGRAVRQERSADGLRILDQSDDLFRRSANMSPAHRYHQLKPTRCSWGEET